MFKNLQPATCNLQLREGFTLLEMLVSIGIFSVVVVASIGATIEISKAQLKSSNLQATQDNVRFTLELLTKELRTGINFQLTSICSSVSEISFDDANGIKRVYFLSGDAIMRIVGSTDCAIATPFTAEDVAVERLIFRMRGTTLGPNDGQPMVTISLTVRSKSPKVALESSMNLQTTIVQRLRDL